MEFNTHVERICTVPESKCYLNKGLVLVWDFCDYVRDEYEYSAKCESVFKQSPFCISKSFIGILRSLLDDGINHSHFQKRRANG